MALESLEMSLLSAKGLSHKGYLTIGEENYACHLTNMSRTGAILIFDGPVDLPDHFTVYLTADRKFGRACELQWSDDGRFGVTFERDTTM